MLGYNDHVTHQITQFGSLLLLLLLLFTNFHSDDDDDEEDVVVLHSRRMKLDWRKLGPADVPTPLTPTMGGV